MFTFFTASASFMGIKSKKEKQEIAEAELAQEKRKLQEWYDLRQKTIAKGKNPNKVDFWGFRVDPEMEEYQMQKYRQLVLGEQV